MAKVTRRKKLSTRIGNPRRCELETECMEVGKNLIPHVSDISVTC